MLAIILSFRFLVMLTRSSTPSQGRIVRMEIKWCWSPKSCKRSLKTSRNCSFSAGPQLWARIKGFSVAILLQEKKACLKTLKSVQTEIVPRRPRWTPRVDFLIPHRCPKLIRTTNKVHVSSPSQARTFKRSTRARRVHLTKRFRFRGSWGLAR